MDGHVVALDVGGTRMKAALAGPDGALERIQSLPTGREDGPETVVQHVLDVAARLCDEETARSGTAPKGIGLTLPGIVDERTGVAEFSANVGWRGVPIGRMLSERLGLPAALVHDVRAAGLAEARLGAGHGEPSFVFIAIGTGIGGAVVEDGRVRTGRHHRAGEIGHLVVAPDGPPCGCGARGCVETLASAAAIQRRYAERTGKRDVDAETVAALVARGDVDAGEVWAVAVDALARGIIACTALVDPGLVVLGGGLAEAGDVLLRPLGTAVDALATFHVPPRLETTRLGDRAGCQGAGLAAWDLVSGAAPVEVVA